jgi:hypothetical protein
VNLQRQKEGTAIKSLLTCSPIIREFEYGSTGEGYWSYEHRVIQLEDCIDCLKVLYPQYDMVFLLDHSCGHDQQNEDGLNAGKMSKTFGGETKNPSGYGNQTREQLPWTIQMNTESRGCPDNVLSKY